MLKLHQALHGYSDGHRQLACSVSLPAKDARLVLVMSDVSGPGVTSFGVPYITGYPLAESGLYALAKTWPAPEMARPGCVWTHTLLIGFTDLAALVSPSVITRLFQRPPTKVLLEDYTGEIGVELQEHLISQPLSPEASDWFERLASAVYEYPYAQVWARRTDGSEVDNAVLRLWDQQWPRLKRSFRFCTLTSRDRSQEGMPFDLQLSQAGGTSSHLRFSSGIDGIEATTKSAEPWLQDLVQDAQLPQDSTLRPFLRRLGADMLVSREAMRPFCSLHAALKCASVEGILDAVRQVADSALFATSELAMTIVAQAAIANLEVADGQVLDFVIHTLPFLPEATIRKHQDHLTQLLWERDPRRVIDLAKDSRNEVHDAIRAGALSIPRATVIRQLTQVGDLAESLLELIPSIAEDPVFWSSSKLHPLTAARVGVELSKAAVLRAMILGLHEHVLIQFAVQVVGAVTVLEQLQVVVNQTNNLDQVRFWLRYACADTNAVAQFFAGPAPPSRMILMLIAEAIQPDAVPNDIGADPWYLALHALVAEEGKLPIELLVYGFQRALGRRSRSAVELLKLTFEALHTAVAKNAIPEDLWRQFERSLPRAPFGQEWDHAISLRRATAWKCNESQMSPEALAHLVGSDALFKLLLEAILDLWGGARYLRSVNNALLKSRNDVEIRRSRLLNDFIKKHAKFW
ncbi:GAP1-N1 domain-containing protein [Chitinimonas sp. BJB300]|uniref:GAP1-N1 domain-containing protein n=1 Tax=Chitinimonas sp. BJB300 TaxID=1559339 RepID=UPI000C0F5A05|nr:hypothetical protein [Chitinimonas sp. BJB300]PHV10311.1 hypothetical protein CSQ89_16885 [Chitinimonas sp. BJB300]TSJ83289.1 hypothetical protein FG002_021255 [Chitinimonas sp. BJB300]